MVCKFVPIMNTNISLSLDTRRPKSDGSFPLVLRLGHLRKTIPIPTGFSLRSEDWDERKRIVKKSYNGVETVSRLNNLIQKQRSEAMEIVVKLHENGELNKLSVSELKNRIHKKDVSQSFILFAQQQIADLHQAGRFGTAKSYKEVLHVVREFIGEKDLRFNQITFQFLTKFEMAHVSRGNSLNGLAVYMRTIRAVYNKAIKSGIADASDYPFTNYKIKTIPTEKRALEWELLKRIIVHDLKSDSSLFSARSFFVASYMMYGMNFSDMAFLKRSDIRNGRIQYRRRKTSKLYDIKISDALATIINHYMQMSPNRDFIFPILKSDDPATQYKEILWARKRYNDKLKILAQELRINQNLTSYVSRHSFATQAMLQQIPLNAISSMLGHSNLKTTEVYLKSLPSSILDDYNERILGSLN